MNRKDFKKLEDEHVVIVSGNKPGPKVAVMVLVHGNEVCGLKALGKIWENVNIENGSVTFIIGNPEAAKQSVRMTEMNLNRAFRDVHEVTEEERNTYEYKRASEIKPYLDSVDYLLDIHSFSDDSTMPFSICEPHSYEVAAQLGVSLISSGWDELEAGGTDYYMNKMGKIGICVECGEHSSESSITFAQDVIKRFLQVVKVTSTMEEFPQSDIRIASVKDIYITNTDFSPSKDFKNFDKIEKGELIGTDGDVNVYAKYSGFIVFAQKRTGPNEEAFLFGDLSSLKNL